MRLFKTIAGLRTYLSMAQTGTLQEQLEGDGSSDSEWLEKTGRSAKTVGLVPTMGALHDGHLSLVQRARQDNDIVVVSIFVNPLQFGPNEDLQRYPRTLEQDCALCQQAGVDVVFAPSPEELYGTAHPLQHTALTEVIPPAAMMAVLCGPIRPGHFEGVATVVTKLFGIVQPNRAYFGQKDAQQLAILQRVAQDLNSPVELVACPIVREPDGLAMSSRNRYLSAEERAEASGIFRSLQKAEHAFRRRLETADRSQSDRTLLLATVHAELARTPAFQVEYVDLVHPQTLEPLEQIEQAGLLAIAARLGTTRLIDNIILRNRKPIVALDGPAGAGKSTVARRVARELGVMYLDTGAMYRAVTWLVLQSGIAITDEPAIAELVSQCEIRLEEPAADSTTDVPQPLQVWINGQNVTQAIRSAEVTSQVSAIAAQAAVRQVLVRQQQAYGRQGGIVMDGRDIGTYVFPDAELKVFLTASVQERARRRQLDLQNQGQPIPDLETLEEAIYQRDMKDSTRAIAPLRKAADAIELQTDGMTIEEVTARIVRLYKEKLSPSLVR